MTLNILFLDDEPMVLEALRRTLRPKTTGWNMQFADTVDIAWKLLETEQFDVVVTDMQIPGSSGSTFLSQLHERLPETVRMVLSGFKDPAQAMRVRGAHRFMLKPILAANLIREISKATELPIPREKRTMARGATHLITTAATAAALRALLDDPSTDTPQILPLVRSDPGLAAKVLQLGNSCFYSARQTGSDIESCLHAIGIESVRLLEESGGLLQTFPAGDTRDNTVADIVRHAQDAANKTLQGSGSTDETNVAYTGALLHVAGALLEAEHSETPPTSCHDGRSGLSVALLQLWGIPSPIIQSVTQFTD